MELRAVLAVLISVLILITYQYLFLKDKQETQEPAAPGNELVQEKPKEFYPPKEDRIQTDKQLKFPTKSEDYHPVVVTTDVVEAEFSEDTGAITKWKLLKYFNGLNGNGGNIELASSELENFKPVDLVFLPSGVKVKDRIKYSLVEKSKGGELEKILVGQYKDLKAQKKLSFSDNDYLIRYEITLKNEGVEDIEGNMWASLAYLYPIEDRSRYNIFGPIYKINDKVSRNNKEQKVDQTLVNFNGIMDWFGFEEKFFTMIFIDPEKHNAQIAYQRVGDQTLNFRYLLSNLSIAPAEEKVLEFKVFMGPKDLKDLRKAGLQEVVNFGTFDIIAKPLLYMLKFFNKYTGNWGIAIIILTVIIKILFFPLSQSSFKSMRKMQQIQPKIMALREKYKDDKQKMNQEMVQLYKTYKVNPLGGCLPMLVQIPVFFALYKILYYSIEIRHAPFMLWIQDLSVKDPYYITPIIMGVCMFVQQKMSPSSPDPTQAKIMLFMPVIFTALFMNFPSGLVLYWLVNNILTIVQMYFVYKGSSKKEEGGNK